MRWAQKGPFLALGLKLLTFVPMATTHPLIWNAPILELKVEIYIRHIISMYQAQCYDKYNAP